MRGRGLDVQTAALLFVPITMATAASLITVGVGTAMLAGTRAVGAAISTDA